MEIEGADRTDDLIDPGALVGEPLIEEPVASGGDSSFWTDGDDEEDDEDEEDEDAPPAP
jgi:hypothetical protein